MWLGQMERVTKPSHMKDGWSNRGCLAWTRKAQRVYGIRFQNIWRVVMWKKESTSELLQKAKLARELPEGYLRLVKESWKCWAIKNGLDFHGLRSGVLKKMLWGGLRVGCWTASCWTIFLNENTVIYNGTSQIIPSSCRIRTPENHTWKLQLTYE